MKILGNPQSKLCWTIMSIAKRTGGWDVRLGKRWGWDYDEYEFGQAPHWHFNIYPYVKYRSEY